MHHRSHDQVVCIKGEGVCIREGDPNPVQYGIWSISGRYASYCNAFVLTLVLTLTLTLGVDVVIEINVFFPSVKASVNADFRCELTLKRRKRERLTYSRRTFNYMDKHVPRNTESSRTLPSRQSFRLLSSKMKKDKNL